MRDEKLNLNSQSSRPGVLAGAFGISSQANVWREHYKIRSYEVDCHGRLSILSIFNFMQEAASKHADELGVSIRQLQSENYTWLLSRLKIKIASYPGWNDRMQVDTWPSGTRRLFALRDFELHDDHHQSIAAAISAWLVIDIRKRRPVQIAPFVDRLKPLSRNHILPDPLDKLPGLEQTSFERSFHVRHRDLDINQHVNNVSFVEWVVESVPVSTLDTSVLSELEINFLAEAFQKDRIRAACHPQNAANTVFHHGIVREQDGQELIRAKTVWRRF